MATAHLLLALGLVYLQAAAAELIIREAGVGGKTGPTLGARNRFCPSDFSDAGFNIECTDMTGPVRFYVNGRVERTERAEPYYVGSNMRDGSPRPWTSYPKTKFDIECRTSSGSESALVIIDCSKPITRPQPTPVAPTPMPTPVLMPTDEPVMDPSQEPVPQPLPPGLTPSPESPVRGPTPAPESPMPDPTPVPAPSRAPGASPSPPPVTLPPSDCVKMVGSMGGELPDGWTRDGDSLWYKRGSTDTTTVEGGKADVDFRFIAPATGLYGLTVDMTTAGETTHNSVYLNFRYALALRKDDVIIHKKAGDYVKAYHNQNGRAVEAWAVENDPHSITTDTPLRAGITYSLKLGASATNVKVHSVIMFPCVGEECIKDSPKWKQRVAACSA